MTISNYILVFIIFSIGLIICSIIKDNDTLVSFLLVTECVATLLINSDNALLTNISVMIYSINHYLLILIQSKRCFNYKGFIISILFYIHSIWIIKKNENIDNIIVNINKYVMSFFIISWCFCLSFASDEKIIIYLIYLISDILIFYKYVSSKFNIYLEVTYKLCYIIFLILTLIQN